MQVSSPPVQDVAMFPCVLSLGPFEVASLSLASLSLLGKVPLARRSHLAIRWVGWLPLARRAELHRRFRETDGQIDSE